MRTKERARFAALALLAAVAGSAAVGIAALAREGVCLHRMLHAAGTMPAAMPGMPGMTMDGSPIAAMPAMSGPCPILIAAALVAAALYLVALVAIAVVRPRPSELALASARIVLGVRFAPLAALLSVAGAVPLGAAIVMDGNPGVPAALVAAGFLLVAAALTAWVSGCAARLVVAFTRRLIVALVAALRLLLSPGAAAPWRPLHQPLLVAAGVRLAARRPSRAPPLRF